MKYLIHTDDGTYLVGTDEHLAHFGFKSKKGKASALLGTVKKGHKYILRVETGKKFPRYEYFYTQAEVDAYNARKKAEQEKQLGDSVGAPITEINDRSYADDAKEVAERRDREVQRLTDYLKDREESADYQNARATEAKKNMGRYINELKQEIYDDKTLKSSEKLAQLKDIEDYRQQQLKFYNDQIKERNDTLDKDRKDVSKEVSDIYKTYADSIKNLSLFDAEFKKLTSHIAEASKFVSKYIDTEKTASSLFGKKTVKKSKQEQHEDLRNDPDATENDYERKVRFKLDDDFVLDRSRYGAGRSTSQSELDNLEVDDKRNVTIYMQKSHTDGRYDTESTEKVDKLPKITKSESRESSQEAVNPNYGKGDEYAYNCQNCTYTYAMRRKGYDVEALPNNAHDPNSTYYGNPSAAMSIFENVATLSMQPKDSSVEATKSLTRQLASFGNGSYGELSVWWYGTPSGHSMIWEVENGEIIIRDAQVGKVYKGAAAISGLLSRTDYSNPARTLSIHRLDTATPNDNVLNCMKARGK